MSAGDVTVALRAGSAEVMLLAQPGMTHRVRLLGLVDGEQRMLDVDVSVVGVPCPDPAVHLVDCVETRFDTLGDCDGGVRLYTVVGPILLPGVVEGDDVAFCASHAQMNGRHVRRKR